jgi:hypothetical protein
VLKMFEKTTVQGSGVRMVSSPRGRFAVRERGLRRRRVCSFHWKSADICNKIFPATLEVGMKVSSVVIAFRNSSKPVQVKLSLKAC